MCQYRTTFYACGKEFVKDSWYKLCADRPNCENKIELWEWNTFCPGMRAVLARPWNMARPEEERFKWSDELRRRLPCTDKLTPKKFESLCKTCNPANMQPGKFYRCSPDCRGQPIQLEPPENPRDFFEWYIERFWPKTPRGQYERRRDVK